MAIYVPPSISNYNDDAPSDDGQETSTNEVKWSLIKDELTDPIKDYAAAISTAVDAMETSGSWTPILSTDGTPFTYSGTGIGTYYTIGRIVVCSLRLNLTSVADGVGGVQITGLPIAAAGTGSGFGAAFEKTTGLSLSAGHTQFIGVVGSGRSLIDIAEAGSGSYDFLDAR